MFSPKVGAPDPEKVDIIHSTPPPRTAQELRSFLGMTNYSSRFIRNYATITEPLRRLTKKDTPWVWSQEQQDAFNTLKNALSEDANIAYFNIRKDIEIAVDASPVGLGAILTQDGRVVAYASRALTPVESRYSQTEREALAIVWACEHYDMYVRGTPHFVVTTDHKPLVSIWQKPHPPLRIERWGLRLQPYKLTVKYSPGHANPADYLSRHPLANSKNTSLEQTIAEQYVNFVTTTSVPRAMNINDIQTATSRDPTLMKAIDLVCTGRWFEIAKITDPAINMDELRQYHNSKNELTCHVNNILLRNDKIVIPKSLRDLAVSLAHEGHQGMARTKAMIRSKVWFPGINEKVEQTIHKCLACQSVYSKPGPFEPLRMSQLPPGAWQNLSMDFCGPLPTGEYLMVIMDEYSRYPNVEIVKSVSANSYPRLGQSTVNIRLLQNYQDRQWQPIQLTRLREIRGI